MEFGPSYQLIQTSLQFNFHFFFIEFHSNYLSSLQTQLTPNIDEMKLKFALMEWNSMAGEEPPAHNQPKPKEEGSLSFIQFHQLTNSSFLSLLNSKKRWIGVELFVFSFRKKRKAGCPCFAEEKKEQLAPQIEIHSFSFNLLRWGHSAGRLRLPSAPFHSARHAAPTNFTFLFMKKKSLLIACFLPPSFHLLFNFFLLHSFLPFLFLAAACLPLGGAIGAAAPITHPMKEQQKGRKVHELRSSTKQLHQFTHNQMVNWLDCCFVVVLAFSPREWNCSFHSLIHSLGPLPPQHTSFQSFFPLGREEWNEMKVLLMARGVIIAGINQLSFIIQNKVFHYCRQQVYSCSNNCTVIILF